jgi:molybdopterin converting factor small subunit
VPSVATTTDTVTVTFRFLARYAEVAGRESLTLPIPAPATVADALAALRADPRVGDRLPLNPLCALNFRQVRPGHPLAQGDEIALLPPLAGG